MSYGGALGSPATAGFAVVSAGYADGYMRSLSGNGVPLAPIRPAQAATVLSPVTRFPAAGRITMDITIFDVTDIPNHLVRAGEYIELFGKNILKVVEAMLRGFSRLKKLAGARGRPPRRLDHPRADRPCAGRCIVARPIYWPTSPRCAPTTSTWSRPSRTRKDLTRTSTGASTLVAIAVRP